MLIDGDPQSFPWFRSLLESLTEGVLIFDQSRTVMYANPAAGEIIGRPPAELLGATPSDLLHLDDRAWVEERLNARFESSEEPEPLQARVLRQDGDLRYVQISSGYLEVEGENAVLVTARDVTRERLAERRLAESEERFRSLFEHTPQIVYDLDPSGKIRALNPAAGVAMGAPRETLIGLNFQDIIHPADAEMAADVFRRALDGESNWYEIRIMRPDGGLIHLRGVSVPIRVEGSIVGVSGIAEDVTERRRIDEALRESEQWLDALLRQMPAIVWTTDTELRLTFLRGRGLEVLDIGAAVGAPLQALVGEDSIGMRAHRRALAGESVRYEDDFQERVVDVHVQPLRDAAGAIAGVLGMSNDVTEVRQAERALAASEMKYRGVLEHATDAIFLLDEEFRITEVNRRAQEMLGYDREELIGRSVIDFGRPAADREETLDVLRRGGIIMRERTFERKDGMGVAVEISVGPMASGFVSIARDITSRRELEQQLVESQKMEAVGRLTGGVAHDFNNLLTAVRGYTELLLEVETDEQKRADLDEIRKAAEQAARLTQQLLAFSRRQLLQPEQLDVNQVVTHLEHMLGRLIGEHVVLQTELQPGLPLVEVDRTRLEQVLVNLVVNARDAMPRGGDLTIRTRRESYGNGSGGWAVLEVQDSGTGIPESARSHVFEPFFTTKPVGQGTGLGLSTVYGIVEQSGGRVDFESSDRGTTFRVYLPLDRSAAAS